MKRCNVVLDGEFLEIDESKKPDGKLVVNLFMLSGRDSYRLKVNDNELWKSLKPMVKGDKIRLRVEVQTYKDELYFTALNSIE